MATTTVTDDTFATEVLASDKTVLVDFWAEWCGPCRQLAPILEEIASEHADKLTVAKMNITDNPTTFTSLGIVNIPTMALYQDGNLKKTIVGAKPKRLLLKDLEEFLG